MRGRRRRRQHALLAQHPRRQPRRQPDHHRRHQRHRLRVGRGPRQRVPAGRAPSGSPRPTAPASGCTDYGTTYARAPATHAMTMYRARQRRARLRRRHDPVGWALDSNHDRGSARRRRRRPAGDRQPARRHGGPARPRSDPAWSRPPRPPTPSPRPPPSPRPRPAPRCRSASPLTVTGTAADTGGGRVGGVEVSTDNGATWHRATGRESWTYTFTPTTTGAADPAGPRHRRQRQHSGAAAAADDHRRERRRPPARARSGRAPPPRTGTDPDTRPGRGRREVPRQHQRLHHRHPLLQARRDHRHPRRLPVVQHRHPPRPTSPSPTRRASGWQQASFATPVAVTAGTTYVASYFTPSPLRRQLATTSPPRPPPAARSPPCQDGTDGGNGVYRYTSTAGAFPNQTCQRENYWVDVVFTDTDTTKPTVTARTPAPGATGVAVGTRRDRDVQRGGPAVDHRVPAPRPRRRRRAGHADVRRRPAAPRRSTRTPRWPPTTTYTAALSGARGHRRQPDGPGHLDLHHRHPGHDQAHGHRPHPGRRGHRCRRWASRRRPPSARRCSRRRSPSSCAAPATPLVPVDDGLQRHHPHRHPRPRTPTLAASTTYTVNLSGARDAVGQPDGPGRPGPSPRRPSSSACPCTIWPSTATPAGTDGDTELGRARREVPGQHRRLRHRHPLLQARRDHRHPRRQPLDRTGTRLGQVTFTDETASGWQQANFATPDRRHRRHHLRRVLLHAQPLRRQLRLLHHRATTRGPLTALQNGTDGGNGLYRYTSTPARSPTRRFNSENYWVDVVFEDGTTPPSRPSRRAPPPRRHRRQRGRQRHRDVRRGGAAVHARPRAPRPGGTLVTGATTYDAGDPHRHPRPAANLAAHDDLHRNLTGVRDTAGNLIDPVSWTFTTDTPDTTKPTRHRPRPRARCGRRARPAITATATFSEAGPGGHDHLRAAHAGRRAGRRHDDLRRARAGPRP